MTKRLIPSILIVLLCFVADLGARTPKTTRVWVDLVARTVSINSETSSSPLGDAYYRVVHSEEAAEVAIRNANPLLFKYSFDVTTTPSESAAAVETFAKAFGELLTRFANKGAGVTTPVIEGLNFTDFQGQINGIFTHVNSMGAWIDMSLEPDKVSDLRDQVKGAAQLVDQAMSWYAKALQIQLKCLRGDSVSSDAGPVPCSAPLNIAPVVAERQAASAYGLLTARLEERQPAAAPLLSARSSLATAQAKLAIDEKAAAASRQNPGLQAAAKKSQEAVSAAEAAIGRLEPTYAAAAVAYDTAKKAADAAKVEWDEARTSLAKVESQAAVNQTTIAGFLRDTLSIQSQVEKAGALLKGFVDDVGGVGAPKPMKSIQYSLNTTTVTIKVEKETKYANYLSAKAKSVQTAAADGKVVISPYRVATVQPGVAFVLGFLRNPEYSTKQSGDKFKIAESSTELTRFNVAAMINVVPRAWAEPTFGGYVQFGISPKNDETAFFVGAGVQLESMLTFGAGLMVQQVRRLDSSQNVGDLLNTPDDLKINHPFKNALYIHGTIALTKK